MREVTLEELLEAGCHFGHQVTRSTPKMRDFIFETRDNIHIIDLEKTKQYLEEGGAFVKSIAKKGGTIIIVGTKRQARGIVEDILRQAQDKIGEGLFYVTSHWVGGLLTNFSEVSKNFEKLKKLSEDLKNEELKAKYTKKEINQWADERQKLESIYGGVSDLKEKPDALFVIDSHLENLAVKEAKRMGVATVAIVDTNADPDIIDYPIPANDDAVGSIKLIVGYIIDAWSEGRALAKKAASDLAKDAKPEVAKIAKEKPAKEIKPKIKNSVKKSKSERSTK